MCTIVDAVASVTHIMQEIATASGEQSRGITQVSQAISEMDKVTQQNASLVEEASTAAVSLEEQAARLTEAVDVFRLNKHSVSADDAPRDKCTLSCAINGIHAAFHYLKKNYISGCVMTVPTG